MRLDEVPTRLDLITHENRKDLIDAGQVFECDPQERARFGIHRGLPQLTRIHFSQSFVPLYAQSLFTQVKNGLYQFIRRLIGLFLPFGLEFIRLPAQPNGRRRQLLQLAEIG